MMYESTLIAKHNICSQEIFSGENSEWLFDGEQNNYGFNFDCTKEE